MKIGVAGPVTLQMLQPFVANGGSLPAGYKCPLMAQLVRELLARGHKVWLYTLAPEVKAPATFIGDNLTIRIGRYRPRARARALDLFAVERADLQAMMNEDPCDLIHSNWTYEFALAALSSNKATLITAHDAPLRVVRYLPNAYRAVRALMAWRVARKSFYMTAVSPYVADHFRNWFRFKRSMTVVPNGVADDIFDRPTRARKDSKAGQFTFACVLTGWGALKNGATALLAFRRVRSNIPDSRLLLIGYGHGLREGAHKWALQNGCDRGVDFIGDLPYQQVLDVLTDQVDVLVHPAVEESFGMVLAEAMALHIPVIAGKNSGGVPFVLDYGKAGRLVDVRCSDAIADAMEELAACPQRRVELAEAGFLMAEQRFRMSAVVGQYEVIYNALGSGGS